MTEGRSGEERRSLDEKSRSLEVEIEKLQAEILGHQETIDRVLKEVPHLEEKWEGLDHLLREGGTPLPKTRWADPGYEWLLADSKYEYYDTSVVEKTEDDFFVIDLLISKDYFTPAEKFAKEEIKKRRGIIATSEHALAEKQSELECIPVEAALQRISRSERLTPLRMGRDTCFAGRKGSGPSGSASTPLTWRTVKGSITLNAFSNTQRKRSTLLNCIGLRKNRPLLTPNLAV